MAKRTNHFNFRISQEDPDLLRWVEQIPNGERSNVIAQALREYMDKHSGEHTDRYAIPTLSSRVTRLEQTIIEFRVKLYGV